MNLNKYTFEYILSFAKSFLLYNGYPEMVPLKLWKVEHSVRYYGSDDRREVISVEFDTGHTDNLSYLPVDAAASETYAVKYFNFTLNADDKRNPLPVDLYINAAVSYRYTDEERDLLVAIGKVEEEVTTVTRKYLVCGR